MQNSGGIPRIYYSYCFAVAVLGYLKQLCISIWLFCSGSISGIICDSAAIVTAAGKQNNGSNQKYGIKCFHYILFIFLLCRLKLD